MDEKEREAIRLSWVKLVDQLKPISVLDHLLQDNIFTPENCADVQSESTYQKQNRVLLDVLQRKGPNAYPAFERALTESGHAFLLDIIKTKVIKCDLKSKFEESEYSVLPATEVVEILSDQRVIRDSDITTKRLQEVLYGKIKLQKKSAEGEQDDLSQYCLLNIRVKELPEDENQVAAPLRKGEPGGSGDHLLSRGQVTSKQPESSHDVAAPLRKREPGGSGDHRLSRGQVPYKQPESSHYAGTWRITAKERAKHDSQFFQLKPVSGLLSGKQAKNFFIKSNIPMPVLGQIWGTADLNGDGKLDKKEFSIAMFLIKRKLQGFDLPKTLPARLKEDPSPSFGAIPAIPAAPVAAGGPLPTHTDLIEKRSHQWTVEDVAQWLRETQFSEEMVNAFLEHEIDGEALRGISRDDLLEHLEIKLGPSHKLIAERDRLLNEEASYKKHTVYKKRFSSETCIDSGRLEPLLKSPVVKTYTSTTSDNFGCKTSTHRDEGLCRKLQLCCKTSNNGDEDLYRKLIALLSPLHTSNYNILVLNALDSGGSDTVVNSFSFLKKIEWTVIFDFDRQAHICDQLFNKENMRMQIYPTCTAARFVETGGEQDHLKSTRRSPWIFANGFRHIVKEENDIYLWKEEKQKRFKSAVMFYKNYIIPDREANVVFLLLSSNYNIMLEGADLLISSFPDQWICIAENKDVAAHWSDELRRRHRINEDDIRNRVIAGMPWKDVQRTVNAELLSPKKVGAALANVGDEVANMLLLSAPKI